MFLNSKNLLNDIKSTSVTLHQISDYHIYEIFVTREKLLFASFDTHAYAYNFQLCSIELFEHLENICSLKINSFCFSSSEHYLDIDIYGENLNINIFELETIRLRNMNNVSNGGRTLKEELRVDILSYLKKEFPLFFTITKY